MMMRILEHQFRVFVVEWLGGERLSVEQTSSRENGQIE
jgi:hypothetical protein